MRIHPLHRLSMLVVCLGAWGALSSCGELHFVISDYAPQQIRVVYSEQEDLTIMSWKLGPQVDTGNVRFELFQNGSWTPVRFEDSPYPAGEFDCDTTCFQLNFPGKYTAPQGGVVLRSLHPEHGVLLGTSASVQVQKVTLSFDPRMKAGNRNVNFIVKDFFNDIGTPEKRTFNYRYFENSSSACPSEVTGGWTGKMRGEDPVFYPLGSDKPSVCVQLQPVPRRALTPVTLVSALWMHPELQSRQVNYKVPVETSPVLYQLLLDLQIPDPDHCNRTRQNIEQQISAAFNARNPQNHAFEVVNIADDGTKQCNQRPDRGFDAVTVAERIKNYVNTSVQQPRGARVLVVYVNNNSIAPPTRLVVDYFTLISSLIGDPRVRIQTWAISTDTILNAQQWEVKIGWVTPSNSAFKEAVTANANMNLPFKSLDHRNTDLIRFLDPQFEGIAGEFKSCSSTPTVQYYVNGNFAFPANGETVYALHLGDEFRFQIDFEAQEMVPATQFREQSVQIRYEVCTKWCQHPFYTAKDEWIGTVQDPDTSVMRGWNRELRCREAP